MIETESRVKANGIDNKKASVSVEEIADIAQAIDDLVAAGVEGAWAPLCP